MQSVEVNGLNYKMDGLNRFTEYTVRVLAINRYGPGTASEMVSVTTQSDGELYLNISSYIQRGDLRTSVSECITVHYTVMFGADCHHWSSKFSLLLVQTIALSPVQN